ncbi:accessory gene regulator B family protein [Cohnella fermenti]
MRYSLSFLLNAFFIIGITLMISVFTGRFTEAVIVLISYAILRQLTGGVHLKSGTLCIVVSTAGATALSLAEFSYRIEVIVTVASLLLILIFAPYLVTITRVKKNHYPIMRAAAMLLVSTALLVDSPPLVASFFVQALTLIHMKGGERT